MRRLVRTRDGRVIAGVASGLGAYLRVDPVVVRLVFVVLTLAGGGGLLAYLVGWLVIPEEPVRPPAGPAAGTAWSTGTGPDAGPEAGAGGATDAQQQTGGVQAPVPGSASGASVVVGLGLVALGGLLLVERLVPAFSWRFVVPVLLIVLGLLLLTQRREKP